MAVDIFSGLLVSMLEQASAFVAGRKDQIRSLDLVFRLHCQVTFAALLFCSGLLQLAKFSGKSISCWSTSAGKSLSSLAPSYCWTEGTFVLADRDAWTNESFAPGLGNERRCLKDGGCQFWLSYYQWTAWVLLLLAFGFYLPRWLWHIVESGQVSSMVRSFASVKDPKAAGGKEKIRSLAADLVQQRSYWTFVLCSYTSLELLNLVCSVISVLLLDLLLGTFSVDAAFDPTDPFSSVHAPPVTLRFRNLGLAFLEYWTSEGGWAGLSVGPGRALFPRVAKCPVTIVGRGGHELRHEFVCFLLLNNVNEKVFVALWFWLHVLVAVAAARLAWRMVSVVILSPGSSGVTELAEQDDDDLDLPVPAAGLSFALGVLRQNLGGSGGPVFREAAMQTLAALREQKELKRK